MERQMGLLRVALGIALCGLATGLIDLKLSSCMKDLTVETMGDLAELTFDPYPPELPGNITVSGTINLRRTLSTNVGVELLIHKKLGFLGYALRIPCIKNLGSCNYTNICGLVDTLRGDFDTTTVTQLTETTTVTMTDTMTSPDVTTQGHTTHPHPTDHTPYSSRAPGGPSGEPAGAPVGRRAADPSPPTGDDTLHPHTPGGPQSTVEMPTMNTDEMQVSASTDSVVTDVDEYQSTVVFDTTFQESSLAGSSSSMPATYAGVVNSECPEVLAQYGLPCKCPFAAGMYHLPPTTFEVASLGSLSGLASLAGGDYRIKVQIYDTDTGEMIACQQAELTLNIGDVGPTQCSGLACLFGK